MELFNDLRVVGNASLYLFLILAFVNVFDILTGLYNAFENHEIKSYKMKNGVVKKAMILSSVILPGLIGLAYANVDVAKTIVNGYLFLLIGVEVASIAENLKDKFPFVAEFLRLEVSKYKKEE